MPSLRILLSYFSCTGNTKIVAKEIVQLLSSHEIDMCEIKSRNQRGHLEWLLISLFPCSRVNILPIINDTSGYDLIIIGSPKWGFFCPLVKEYLNRLRNCTGRIAGVFVTYGGFDGQNYLNRMVNAMAAKGFMVSSTFITPRRRIGDNGYFTGIKAFCEALELAAHNRMTGKMM